MFLLVPITNHTLVPLLSLSLIVQDNHYHHQNDWQYDKDNNEGDGGVSDDCGGGSGTDREILALKWAVGII